MDQIVACPVCKGRIAYWTLRSRFSCHHCHTVLAANLPAAVNRAVAVGVAVEILFLGAMSLSFDDLMRALGLWLSAGGVLGFLVGVVAFRYLLKLSIVGRPAAQ